MFPLRDKEQEQASSKIRERERMLGGFKITCYNCYKYDYYTSECWSCLFNEEEAHFVDEKEDEEQLEEAHLIKG